MFKGLLLALCLFGFQVDYGGDVIEKLQQFYYLKQSQQEFVIPDVCISACTMFLGLPKVCVQDGTVFGFHSAYYMDGNKPIPSKFGNDILLDIYPPKVKDFVVKNKFLDSLDLSFVNAKTMYALGIKECN